MTSLGVVTGGHVRIGLEDNLFFDVAKTQPATNVGLVERVVALARAYERPIATVEQARGIIGLQGD
jgi:3-keto-5-aminohexanoate cleavage enzyme